MKKTLLVIVLSAVMPLLGFAQKGVIGEKAATLDNVHWIGGSPATGNKPMLLEFFLSSSKPSVERIAVLDRLAESYAGKLNVVVVAREPLDRLSMLTSAKHGFSVAHDTDGSIYSSFGVKFVPYAVLVDSKGRIAWVGNPSSLNDADIKAVK